MPTIPTIIEEDGEVDEQKEVDVEVDGADVGDCDDEDSVVVDEVGEEVGDETNILVDETIDEDEEVTAVDEIAEEEGDEEGDEPPLEEEVNGLNEDEVDDLFLQKVCQTAAIEEEIEGADENNNDNNDEDKDEGDGDEGDGDDRGYDMDEDNYCETDLEDYSDDEVDIYDSVSIYKSACGKSEIRPLGRFIDQCSTSTVHITRTCLSYQQCTAFAASLDANLELKVLDLADCQLCGRSIKALLSNLSTHDKLATINLSKNELGVEGVEGVATLLAANTSIRNLNLHSTRLDEHLFALLVPALEMSSITHLDLSGNKLGEQSGILLKGFLETNSLVEKLNISWNAISMRGGKAIADALCSNTTLKALDAGWNGFADEGAIAFAKTIRENSSLIDLDLSNNRIGTEGFKEMVKALGGNTSLQSLHIAMNPIEEEAMNALVDILSTENTTLRHVDAENIPVSAALSGRVTVLTSPSKNLLDERRNKRNASGVLKELQIKVFELSVIDTIREYVQDRKPSNDVEEYVFNHVLLALNRRAMEFVSNDVRTAILNAHVLETKMYLLYCGFCGASVFEETDVNVIEGIQSNVYDAVMTGVKAYVECTTPSNKLKAAKTGFASKNTQYLTKFSKRIGAGYISSILFVESIIFFLSSSTTRPVFQEDVVLKDKKKRSSEEVSVIKEYIDKLISHSKAAYGHLPLSVFSLASFEYSRVRKSNARDNREARIAASKILNDFSIDTTGDENVDGSNNEDDDDILPVPTQFENIAQMSVAIASAKKAALAHPKEAKNRAENAALKTLQEYSMSGVDDDGAIFKILQKVSVAYAMNAIEAEEYSGYMKKKLEKAQQNLESINDKISSCVKEAHENGFRPLLHITTDAVNDGQMGQHGKSSWELFEEYMGRHHLSMVDIFKQYDVEHTGLLSKEVFISGILDLGVGLTEEEVLGMLEQEGIRESEDGNIEYFRVCKRRALKRMATQEMVCCPQSQIYARSLTHQVH
eukprot:m.53570 g.53570  ORF g.53570 m.53570 type:complete len:991 (-) comp11045_c0_seq1:226-3198(-)